MQAILKVYIVYYGGCYMSEHIQSFQPYRITQLYDSQAYTQSTLYSTATLELPAHLRSLLLRSQKPGNGSRQDVHQQMNR